MAYETTIIIPTLDRPESLDRCLKSLRKQTFTNFEVILVREKGELAKLRNQGARRAKGKTIIFIDDDVLCPPRWLESILETFSRVGAQGVSGPALIPFSYRSQRDIFRYHIIKRAYDLLFLEGKAHLPGHITKAGAWTTGACEETCAYEGPVQFLEACNMAWKAKAFWDVGGFDENYSGIGDWSEPDLAFRVRERGGKLWFTPKARLEHLPDKTGAYLSRERTGERYSNYLRFSEKWVRPCAKHTLYKLFLRGYFGVKEIKWHLNRLMTAFS